MSTQTKPTKATPQPTPLPEEQKWFCSRCKVWYNIHNAVRNANPNWDGTWGYSHRNEGCMDKGDWNRMNSNSGWK